MKSSTKPKRSSLLPLNWPMGELPGMKAEDADLLSQHGIETTSDLLHQANTTAQREALAIQLAVPVRMVNKWVVMADLARIPAVGCQYCGLLLHMGICSTVQLARTPIANLQNQVVRFQVSVLHRSDRCPEVGQLSDWIQQAKQILVAIQGTAI